MVVALTSRISAHGSSLPGLCAANKLSWLGGSQLLSVWLVSLRRTGSIHSTVLLTATWWNIHTRHRDTEFGHQLTNR